MVIQDLQRDQRLLAALAGKVQELEFLKASYEGKAAGALFASREHQAKFHPELGWRFVSVPESMVFTREAEKTQARIDVLEDAMLSVW